MDIFYMGLKDAAYRVWDMPQGQSYIVIADRNSKAWKVYPHYAALRISRQEAKEAHKNGERVERWS